MDELQAIGTTVEELRERVEHMASTSEGHKARELGAAAQHMQNAVDLLAKARSRED